MITSGTVEKATAAEVRAFVYMTYVWNVRQQGLRRISIKAGDVHRQMGLVNRVPLVCSVLDSGKFESEYGVRKVGRAGPAQSTTTTFEFEL